MEERLLSAIETLATSAMGIEQSLNNIADRLDGIEDSFVGLTITVRNNGDRDTNLMHITEQLMDINRNFEAFCDWQSEKP